MNNYAQMKLKHQQIQMELCRHFIMPVTVVDPGFPRCGGQPSAGTSTYDFVKISQKLHENERIWTRGGGGGVLGLQYIRK